MAAYEFRPYRPGDEHAILATFNRVFGAEDPAFRARTLADWEWAYARNPGGLRVYLALAGDVVAAHYASLPSDTWIDGEVRTFAQIVDSMVHPDHRKGLKRPGLFVETAQRMLDRFCGPDKDLVTYGWPIRDAWRIGASFLRYEVVRTQSFLVSNLDGATPDDGGAHELARFPEAVLELYERCRAPWGASIVRDARFLDWRFAEHPTRRYRIFAVPGARPGALAGALVFRSHDFPVPGSGLIADWLVPEGELEVGRALVAAAARAAREAGCRVLLHMLPSWSRWFAAFQTWGFLVQPSGYLLSGRKNRPQESMDWLRDRWWYTFAEVDLV